MRSFVLFAFGLVLVALLWFRPAFRAQTGPQARQVAVLAETCSSTTVGCGGPQAPVSHEVHTSPPSKTVDKAPAPERDSRVRRAQELLAEGREEAAIKLFEEVLVDNPKHEMALTELAILLSEKTGQESRATELLEKAIEANPKSEIAVDEYARLTNRLGGPEAVKDAIGKYAEKYPDSVAIAGVYGKALLETGDSRTAIVFLEKATANPFTAESSYFALAEAYRRTGDHKRAAEAHSKVVESQEKFLQRHQRGNGPVEALTDELANRKIDLARSLLESGNIEKAEKILDELPSSDRKDVQRLREQLARTRG